MRIGFCVPAVAIGVLLLAACGAERSPAPPPGTESAVVARVGDGDSLELEGGIRVRLLQVDAPELGEGECFGEEATELLRELLPPGTRIELEADPALDDTDRYGRLLRYVLRRGENVNVELVRLGAAAPYLRGGEEGAHADALLAAVDEARAEERGLWGACRVDWRPDRQIDTNER